MAEHLARIIGTEEDRVNCPFYWKIGACRHGDQCSRSHYKPTSSQTLVLRHMYHNPPVALAIAEGQDVDDELADKAQDHFEMFYEEVFEELANYGQIEEMVVCDNIGDHMIGNLYVKYASEDDAEKAVAQLRGRYYAGRMIEVEFSPVTDFREARCRQFVDGQCTRGGYCNFMHMKHVPRSLKRKMMKRMFEEHSEYKKTAAMYTDDPSRGGSRRYDGGPPSSRYYRDSHGARDRSDIYASRRAGGGNDASGRDDWHQQRHHSRQYNSSAGASRDYGTGNDRRAGYSSRSQYDDHHHHHSSSGYKSSSSRHEYHGSRRGYSPADEHRERPRDAGRRQDGGRQSSQERRAMIAQWNKEADDSAAAAAGKGPSVVETEMYPNNGTAGIHDPLTNNGPQGAPVGRSAGAPPSDPEMFFNAAARP